MARRIRYAAFLSRSPDAYTNRRRILNFVRLWVQNHFHDFEEKAAFDSLNGFAGMLQVTGMSKACEALRQLIARKVRANAPPSLSADGRVG
jgi:hemerythrin-like domain-containing protein